MTIRNLAEEILRLADPSIRIDSLPDDQLSAEAFTIAQDAIDRWSVDDGGIDPGIANVLSDRQLAEYASLLRIADDYGPWTIAGGSEGADYLEVNAGSMNGLCCKNCVFYGDWCQIVSVQPQPHAICRYGIIPDSRIVRNDSEERLDGKVIRWGGLDIMITHEPGMQRFPGSNPMRARYGRINRSYGQGEDGKAIDVYVNPDFDPDTDNNQIYRVTQTKPYTGEVDERKLFFGYQSPADVRLVHSYHAGAERFGSVEAIKPSELDVYRKDSSYHADSCGCEACSAKASKRKRKKKSEEPVATVQIEERQDTAPQIEIVVEAEPEPKKPEVVQDADDPDTVDLINEKAQETSKKAITQWVNAIGSWVKKQSSIESAATIIDEPAALYKKLKSDVFANTLAEAMILADLAGQSEVLDEIKRSDSLSDDLLRLDAKPEWFKLPFQEAIDYFRKKIAIPVESYKKLDDSYHEWAFSIAGVTKADVLNDAKWLVDKAISDGTGFDNFKAQWARLIGRKGWALGENRLQTIYDTNLRSAFGQGRATQMLDPEVQKRRPLLLWRWRDSVHPRPTHKALNNKAIPADHEFWDKTSLPAGYGCRCSCFAVSEEYCKRNGIEILKNPPDPETIAEPGFRRPLRGMSDKDKDAIIEEMKGRLPESLAKLT